MGSSANTATMVSHQLFWAHGSAYENSGGCNASFLHWLTLEQLSLEEVVTPSLDIGNLASGILNVLLKIP